MDRNQMTTRRAPALLDGRTVSEIVFPVTVDRLHEPGEGAAARLGGLWGIPVRLVHVTNSIEGNDPDLEALARRLRGRYPDQEFQTTHLYGEDPGKAICDTVNVDSLVFITSQRADEWKANGSIAEEVLRCGGVPLLTLGPEAELSSLALEIVIGLDGSAAAETALAVAKGLAEVHGNRLWLVRVVPEPEPGAPLEHHPEIVQYLEDRVNELGGLGSVGWEIIQSNNPVEAITGFADVRRAGLIVAGSKATSEASRRYIGSVTMGLISTARQPVLAVASTKSTKALSPGGT